MRTTPGVLGETGGDQLTSLKFCPQETLDRRRRRGGILSVEVFVADVTDGKLRRIKSPSCFSVFVGDEGKLPCKHPVLKRDFFFFY